MTIKQQTNHGNNQKVCHLHNIFFIPFSCVTLCQFNSFISLVLFTKINKLWDERKEDLLYIWLLQGITRIIKEVKNSIFRHSRIFRHTCMYKQPIMTK